MAQVISVSGYSQQVLDAPTQSKIRPRLFDLLQKRGFLLSAKLDSDYFIAINHNSADYNRFIENGGTPSQCVLIRLEPESVFPAQFNNSIHSKYRLIFTPGSTMDHLSSDHFSGWPYQFHLNPSKPNEDDPNLINILNDSASSELFDYESWAKRPNTITMVAANKVSPKRHSNYSIRRELATEIPPEILYVYGALWKDNLRKRVDHRLWVARFALSHGILPNLISLYANLLTNYPTARGSIKSKHEVLQKSKFSLVVENSNSYVSEKLFDALINGCIPIYIGPRLEDVGLPAELAIEGMRSAEDIEGVLQDIGKEKIQSMLLSINSFLRSSLFLDLWTEESVWTRISDEISIFFGKGQI